MSGWSVERHREWIEAARKMPENEPLACTWPKCQQILQGVDAMIMHLCEDHLNYLPYICGHCQRSLPLPFVYMIDKHNDEKEHPPPVFWQYPFREQTGFSEKPDIQKEGQVHLLMGVIVDRWKNANQVQITSTAGAQEEKEEKEMSKDKEQVCAILVEIDAPQEKATPMPPPTTTTTTEEQPMDVSGGEKHQEWATCQRHRAAMMEQVQVPQQALIFEEVFNTVRMIATKQDARDETTGSPLTKRNRRDSNVDGEAVLDRTIEKQLVEFTLHPFDSKPCEKDLKQQWKRLEEKQQWKRPQEEGENQAEEKAAGQDKEEREETEGSPTATPAARMLYFDLKQQGKPLQEKQQWKRLQEMIAKQAEEEAAGLDKEGREEAEKFTTTPAVHALDFDLLITPAVHANSRQVEQSEMKQLAEESICLDMPLSLAPSSSDRSSICWDMPLSPAPSSSGVGSSPVGEAPAPPSVLDKVVMKFTTQDGWKVDVPLSVMSISHFITNTLNELAEAPTPGEMIDIPVQLESGVFAKVVEWCRAHEGQPDPVVRQDPVTRERKWFKLTEEERNFLAVPIDELVELMMAANYLDIPSLYHYSCQTYASLLTGKSAQQMRDVLGVQENLTEEEEAEIRRRIAWCND